MAQAAGRAHAEKPAAACRGGLVARRSWPRGASSRILADQRPADNRETTRVLLCSGKLYLRPGRIPQNSRPVDDVAILRVEQFYPLADEAIRKRRSRLTVTARRSIGCRKNRKTWEPERIGRCRFGDRLFDRLPFDCIARPESASPATGSKAIHKREQHRLLEQAFG